MKARHRHLSAGIDVGAGAVKVAVMGSDAGEGGEMLCGMFERIRRRDVAELTERVFKAACEEAGATPGDLCYVATTGDGEIAGERTGHFYTMTTHARGALHLDPNARGALDVGALHARALKMDAKGRVLAHRMTSQCASGSGQFIENIARYLGVPLDDVGALSAAAKSPEAVSGICAVLAETDVINMVSRGISVGDILRGVHDSIAGRLARLLRAIGVEGAVMLTGGLSRDAGLVEALRAALDGETGKKGKGLALVGIQVKTHEHGILAGAIGAALLGAYRHVQLEERARVRASA